MTKKELGEGSPVSLKSPVVFCGNRPFGGNTISELGNLSTMGVVRSQGDSVMW